MVIDLAIAIKICLLDDIAPDLLIAVCGLTSSKDSHQFTLINLAITIGIESLECLVEIILAQSLFSVKCSSDELLVVDDSIIICVYFLDHVHQLRLIDVEEGEDLAHTPLQLLNRKSTVIIRVKSQKHFLQI